MQIANILLMMAVATAAGLVSLMVVNTFTIHEVYAGGCAVDNPAFNASKSRCFGHGPN